MRVQPHRPRPPEPGDELIVVGIWGGAQERIVKTHIEPVLVEKHGVTISCVLGGTIERRARAYSERGRPSFDVIYLNIFESRQAVKDGVTRAPTDSVPNYANLYDSAGLVVGRVLLALALLLLLLPLALVCIQNLNDVPQATVASFRAFTLRCYEAVLFGGIYTTAFWALPLSLPHVAISVGLLRIL